MNVAQLVNYMAQNGSILRALVQGLTDAQSHARPAPGSWSVCEVLCHLLDEEREDFAVRIDYAFHHPGETAPRIAPGAWVEDRRYNEQDPAQVLEGFLRQRELSLAWLRALADADWETTYPAPWGPIRAGDLAAAWLAHDVLHLRQLVELRWHHLAAEAAPYDVQYAGPWQESAAEQATETMPLGSGEASQLEEGPHDG
jgi:hypothetical protein